MNIIRPYAINFKWKVMKTASVAVNRGVEDWDWLAIDDWHRINVRNFRNINVVITDGIVGIH